MGQSESKERGFKEQKRKTLAVLKPKTSKA
jgi:hypothetical protein